MLLVVGPATATRLLGGKKKGKKSQKPQGRELGWDKKSREDDVSLGVKYRDEEKFCSSRVSKSEEEEEENMMLEQYYLANSAAGVCFDVFGVVSGVLYDVVE